MGERRERVGDLLGELAGGDQDEPARRRRPCGASRRGEPGQHRQAEGEGLARAGLRAAEDVTAGEGVGDRAGLDGERRVQPAPGQDRHQAIGEPERRERGRGRGSIQRCV